MCPEPVNRHLTQTATLLMTKEARRGKAIDRP